MYLSPRGPERTPDLLPSKKLFYALGIVVTLVTVRQKFRENEHTERTPFATVTVKCY